MPDESKENQKTLKGGISYYTYIWRTEPGACDTCEELDGTEYTSVDDIPNKPHPNCKCYIDVVENNKDEEENDNDEENNTDEEYSENDNSNYDNESDDDRKEYYDLTDEAIGDCDSLIDEIQASLDEFNSSLFNSNENIKDYIEEKIEQLKDFLNELFSISYSLKDLYSEIGDMELREIKNKLKEYNTRIDFIKDIFQQVYVDAKKEIGSCFDDTKVKLRNTTTDKLSDYIKKHPEIKEKLKNLDHRITKHFIGKHYGVFLNDLAGKTYGKNTAGMLDLAHPKMNNPNYIENTEKLGNYNDKKVAKYQKYLKNKIEKQYKDYENIDPKNVDGRYFKSNSNPSVELSNTKEIKEFIKQHKNEIINNTLFNKKEYLSIEFPVGDWYYAIHYADIIDAYFDKNRNLHIILFDTNDYNIDEKEQIIKAGATAMQKGELKPKYIIWDILIKKDEFDRI